MIGYGCLMGVFLSVTLLVAGCVPAPDLQPTNSPLSTLEPITFASVLPTPDPNAATVVGRLEMTSESGFVEGLIVFLERTSESHVVPSVIYAPPNDQPRAVTDATGAFVISNVPDGEYIVVIYSPPVTIQVATLFNRDQPLLVSAQAGKVIDVGIIQID